MIEYPRRAEGPQEQVNEVYYGLIYRIIEEINLMQDNVQTPVVAPTEIKVSTPRNVLSVPWAKGVSF